MANNRNPLLDFASSFLISYGVSKATTEAIRQHDYEKQQREAERQRRERQQEVKKIVRETAAAKNRLNAAPEKAAPQPQPKTNPILDVIKAEKRAYAKECFERAQRERNNTNK